MSKPVPVYRGSSCPCSPACAVLGASRCLAAPRVALPVHGVSLLHPLLHRTPAISTSRRPALEELGGAIQGAVPYERLNAGTRGEGSATSGHCRTSYGSS